LVIAASEQLRQADEPPLPTIYTRHQLLDGGEFTEETRSRGAQILLHANLSARKSRYEREVSLAA
jgi:hypothetical protein